MARVTVSVEGDPLEVRAALVALLGGASTESRDELLVQGESTQAASAEGQSPWSEEEVRRLWGYLTHSAQRVLAEIATRPEGYPMAELESALDSSMATIGGNLSSVGHAMRRMFGPNASTVKKWPLEQDRVARRYVMDENVAAAIERIND